MATTIKQQQKRSSVAAAARHHQSNLRKYIEYEVTIVAKERDVNAFIITIAYDDDDGNYNSCRISIHYK